MTLSRLAPLPRRVVRAFFGDPPSSSAVLSEGDVRVVDPGIFARLDSYSAPRLVTYTCEDFEERYAEDSDTAGASGGGVGLGGWVTVASVTGPASSGSPRSRP